MKPVVAAIALSLFTAVVSAQNPPVTVNVDASGPRQTISPLIYGTAEASTAQLSDLNFTLNRSGGNAMNTYNWQANATNRAQDWYFESLPEPSAVAGATGDDFFALSRAGGAEPMLTFPMQGWVAKLGANRGRLSSFSIAKYGPQQDNDWEWFPDAGNGIALNGTKIVNDPNDANLPADVNFQLGWMQHLKTKWGTAATGGLRYYVLSNEPGLWHETHRDVHPNGTTMSELRQKVIDYATAVKTNDPTALVLAPEEWGWLGYLYSGADHQWASTNNNWNPANFPDRQSHGGADLAPWLLDEVRDQSVANGVRLLDYFTLHYYPQGGEFNPWNEDLSTSMQLRRNRSTRSLWDPDYTDETWIAQKINLIPRMKQWVAANYPGTKTGVTEYNWGAEGHMNGATTQADVLGIFGREGLDMAARWTTPATNSPAYLSMKMFRNYDGTKKTFGDVSVSAQAPSPDNVSAFAALRTSDGALTVMVINKYLTGTTSLTLNVSNHSHGAAAARWQLASGAITHPADVTFSGNTLTATLPAQSVTLLVIPCVNPVILQQPQNKSITAGQSTTLSATTSAAGATFQWYRGASGVTTDPVVGATASSVEVTPAVTTQYWVRVSNDCFHSDSSASTVTVSSCIPPSITAEPLSSQVNQGAGATLSVTVSGTASAFQWYLGASGNTSAPIAGATASSLTVHPSSTTQYWVRVSSACGSDDSAAATVTVVPATAVSFYTLTPCRVFDSRLPANAPSLAAGSTRRVNLASLCGVPSTARAVSLNVTVVPRGVSGHLRLYPADSALPPSSTINFRDRVRANNGIIPLAQDGSAGLMIFAGGATVDAIIDVNGYFQ
jgi:hypothetical protein